MVVGINIPREKEKAANELAKDMGLKISVLDVGYENELVVSYPTIGLSGKEVAAIDNIFSTLGKEIFPPQT